MENYAIETAAREDVFQLVKKVYNNINTTEAGLDPESKRLLELTYKGSIQSGLGLPEGPVRDKYKALRTRISDLETQFSTTMNEEKGGIWFTRAELAGVP